MYQMVKETNFLRVFPNPNQGSKGTISFAGQTISCTLGKGGVRPEAIKIEGDGATPAGLFYARALYYRPDRISSVNCKISKKPLTQKSGWCDDPECVDYNRPVHLPHASRCETLWRNDHVYDLILMIGYNEKPTIPEKGSAIFFHIARENFAATEGCVALAKDNLLEILKALTPETLIRIHQRPTT